MTPWPQCFCLYDSPEVGFVQGAELALDWHLAVDPGPGLRAGWTLQALGTLPLGQYRQPILCFAHEGFAVQRYLQG